MSSQRHSRISWPSSISLSAQRTRRYHPYWSTTRICRFSDDSASPSPPCVYFARPVYAAVGIDLFSSLPQELIEQTGLLACEAPFIGDASLAFPAERHRVTTLHALCLVSKQFNNIFNPLLYLEPFIIDTQHADSLDLPNSATIQLHPSFYPKARLAKRFTLWRPHSEERQKDFVFPRSLCHHFHAPQCP